MTDLDRDIGGAEFAHPAIEQLQRLSSEWIAISDEILSKARQQVTKQIVPM